MLNFQLIQAPFRYGVAEGVEPHSIPFGVLTELENYAWVKTNLIQKRQGTDWLGATITGGGSLTSAKRLLTRNFGKELCLIDGLNLYSYSPSPTPQWALISDVPNVEMTQYASLDPARGIQSSDSATTSLYTVTAYVPGDPSVPAASTINVIVTSADGTSVLLPPTVVNAVANTVGVRVIIIGDSAIIVGAGGLGNIQAWILTLSTLALSGPTVLFADKTGASLRNWDAQPVVGSTNWVLVYETTVPNRRTTIFDATLAVVATSTDVSTGAAEQISVAATAGESICVAVKLIAAASAPQAWIADINTTVRTFGPTAISAAITTGRVGVCRFDATNYVTCVSNDLPAGHPFVVSQLFTNAAALVAGSDRTTYASSLISTPFVMNGRCYFYACIYLTSSLNPGSFVGNQTVCLEAWPGTSLAGSSHLYRGLVDPLLGSYSASPLPKASVVNGIATCGLLFLGTAPSSPSPLRCGVRIVTLRPAGSSSSDIWRSVDRGQETFFSGSPLSVYDGSDVFDHGFVRAPFVLSTAVAAAGGLILLGTYLYGVHLEYRSSSGLLFRSQTSVTDPVVNGAGNTSQVTLTSIMQFVGNKRHITNGRGDSYQAIYRTVANGSIPQRLSAEPLLNVQRVDYDALSYVHVDQQGDANIGGSVPIPLASRPALYTSGGTLDDQQPPANLTMFRHVDRLFVLAGDQRTWWYSKTFGDDLGTAPGFHVNFRISMPEEQVAGASMDDKAIFFAKAGISYMLGNGPAKDGTASDFTVPVKIQTDLGCTAGRSVVSVPDGIMFQSLRGIMILTRGLEVEWIGRPVRDTLAAFPVITSAVLVPRRNEVRFTANDAAGESGRVLVYNYAEKQWSTFSYKDVAGTGAVGCAIADACLWNDSWTFATPLGIVYKESDTHHKDNAAEYVPGTIETAWNNASGPIQYQAVRSFHLQGSSATDHDLTISIAFDSSSVYQQTRTFPALSQVTTPSDYEEARISVGKRRKGNAIRFKIEDTTPSTPGSAIGTGKGPSFFAMGYDVGIKKGDNTSAGRKG